jgi:uncharacterized protein (TIRG00374 family)
LISRTNKSQLFGFKLSVSVIALYIIFSKTDSGQVFAVLKNIDILFFLAAVLLFILSQLLASIRWKYLLPEKFKIKRLFSLYMVGSFFSNFLPGVVGGDVVKGYYLNKHSKKISLTLGSIFMDRYMGYVGLITIGILAFPYAMHYFGESVYRWSIPIIFTAFVIGSLLFFSLQPGKRFKLFAEFYEYLSSLKSNRDIIIKAFLISLLIQLITYSKIIILAIALQVDIPLLVFFGLMPIAITLTTLPISIAGVGIREGSFVVLLGLIGITPEAATALALAWFLSTIFGSLPGLLVYLNLKSGRSGQADEKFKQLLSVRKPISRPSSSAQTCRKIT